MVQGGVSLLDQLVTDGPGSDAVPAGEAGVPTRECAALRVPLPAGAGPDGARFPPVLTTAEAQQFLPATKVPGQLYVRYCTTDGTSWLLVGGFVFQPPTPTGAPVPAPAPAPQVLALQALANAHVPAPRIGTAPPYRNDTVVGIATWLWIDPNQWHPLSASAAAGGLTVTATVTPTTVTWDMGEGHDKQPTVCHYPGTIYNTSIPDDIQHTDCSYVFQWASWDHRDDTPGTDADDLYHAHTTIDWQVTWAASDGEFGTLADLTSTTPFDLRVEDVQAVVCENTHLGDCHPPNTAP